MQYLGGKSRIAKEIAAIVAPKGYWWEPFCGGLSVSVQLAKYGPGLVSDANPALIALYQAVRDGWVPPTSVSEEEYRAAKLLPDSDPRKAFAGFACSFGAKWFAGYAAEVGVRAYRKAGEPVKTMVVNKPAAGAKAIARDSAAIAACDIKHASFFDITPGEDFRPECIYADPPYAGVTGYAGVGRFDHPVFWDRCRLWADHGVRVFVSEYASPEGCAEVWSKSHRDCMRNASGGKTLKTERLFRVLPTAKSRAA